MKKLLIILFSILLSFNSYGGLFDKTVCVETDAQERDGLIYLPNKTKPFSGKNLCKYEDGQKKSQGKYKDSKKNGKWTWWYKNTQKEKEGKYTDDKLEGQLTMWHENGKIKKPICIDRINGELDAILRNNLYYSLNNGTISKIPYTGSYLCNFNETSQLNNIGIFTDLQTGTQAEDRMRHWDTIFGGIVSGIIEGEIIEGKNVYETQSFFYKNSQIGIQVNLKNNMLNGNYDYWYENGQIMIKGNYKDGNIVDGKATLWYESGQIKKEGNYKDGKLEGKYKDWNENGQIESESNWKDGECISGDCPD